MELKDKQDIQMDPFSLFAEWYAVRESSEQENYNAVALSTAGNDCRVSSRMVLLKDWDNRGFVFFTNYESRKGVQLEQNPYASLLFHWPGQGRQLRIEGLAVKTATTVSDDYFRSRIHGHKINALVSPQSSQIPDHRFLFDRYKELLGKYPEPMPESHQGLKAGNQQESNPYNNQESEPARPPYWGGYRLKPLLFEFWQEGDNRLHDRMEYTLSNSVWHTRRLAP